MEKAKEELFKVNAVRFYTNEDPNPNIPELTDKQYDELEKEYGQKGSSLIQSDSKVPNDHKEDSLNKITGVEDFVGEVINQASKLKRFILTYKYDGSALRAEYRDGKLYKIISTPDEEFCLDVTNKFRFLFPENVDPEIMFIRGELVVDPDATDESGKKFGQKARNKANGLVISKYQEDDIRKYAEFRAYNLEFSNGEYNFDKLIKYLDSLPTTDHFKVAERLTTNDIPNSPIVHTPSGDSVLVDGVVFYTENSRFAVKFYFTEIQKTVIKDIQWGYNEKNGGYTPTYIIEPVILNDKRIGKVATGGVPNMISNGGIGTETYVILSKMTIPKIYTNNTYEPNIVDGNYGDLRCTCGTLMDLRKDLYGSNLRCSNPQCTRRIQSKKSRYDASEGWEYNLNEVLGLDRFKVKELSEDVISELDDLKNLMSIEARAKVFCKIMETNFKLTDLQKKLLQLNAYAFCLCM